MVSCSLTAYGINGTETDLGFAVFKESIVLCLKCLDGLKQLSSKNLQNKQKQKKGTKSSMARDKRIYKKRKKKQSQQLKKLTATLKEHWRNSFTVRKDIKAAQTLVELSQISTRWFNSKLKSEL